MDISRRVLHPARMCQTRKSWFVSAADSFVLFAATSVLTGFDVVEAQSPITPTYTASVRTRAGGIDDLQISLQPVIIPLLGGEAPCPPSAFQQPCTRFEFGSASAGVGHLTAHAEARVQRELSQFASAAVKAGASMLATDVTFTGPDPFVDTVIGLVLDGSQQTTVMASPSPPGDPFLKGRGTAASGVGVSVEFYSRDGENLDLIWRDNSSREFFVDQDGNVERQGRGPLSTIDGDLDDFVLPFELRNLPVGKPLTGLMALGVQVEVIYDRGVDTTAVAESSFARSLSLPTDRPVFELPAGFTVNSTQLNIVNNRYLGQQLVATPAPTTLVMFATGLGLIGLFRQYRRHYSN